MIYRYYSCKHLIHPSNSAHILLKDYIDVIIIIIIIIIIIVIFINSNNNIIIININNINIIIAENQIRGPLFILFNIYVPG